ncbi:MAG: exo-alpha-sialidase [Verrucomicrobia bacterium]|nr:exo-alpha-sialidase [Verrucomicrobiota bacterium]
MKGADWHRRLYFGEEGPFHAGMSNRWLILGGVALLGAVGPVVSPRAAEAPFHEAELIFPLEVLHNHASCVVETPRGDLLVCWFRGTGERTADDVQILGARRRAGERGWSPPFVLADTPAFPDGNPCLFVDPDGRLWLFHTTILANTWESALLKYRISRDYDGDGPPRWGDERGAASEARTRVRGGGEPPPARTRTPARRPGTHRPHAS